MPLTLQHIQLSEAELAGRTRVHAVTMPTLCEGGIWRWITGIGSRRPPPGQNSSSGDDTGLGLLVQELGTCTPSGEWHCVEMGDLALGVGVGGN